MLAMTASCGSGDPMTKLTPTDLMRAALIVEGQALEMAWDGYGDPPIDPTAHESLEDLRRLATGLRELACSTD